MMTRKHFETVARILKERFEFIDGMRPARGPHSEGYDLGYSRAVETIATELADYFRFENPNFDRERFLDACGLWGGE